MRSTLRCLLLTVAISGGITLAQTAPAPAPASAPATSTGPATTTAATRPAQTPVLADNTRLAPNVYYGGPDATLNVLDIYAPAKTTGAPVIMFVHGGEWSRGDKANISSKPKFFNEHGIVFVAINYRLSPKDPHPAQVDDVARAFRWIKDNIANYGGDGDKVVIMGHSAGCHLVTMTALCPDALAKVKLKPADIRGAIAWSGGMYDLADRAKGTGMYPPFIKATFGESEDAQRAASPMTYAKNAKNAPPLLIASVDDAKSASSRAASDKLIEAVNAAGGDARKAILEGKTHFTANHEVGAEGDKTGAIILDFVTSVTRNRP